MLLSAFSSTICRRRLSSHLKSGNPHRKLPLNLVSSHRLGNVDSCEVICSSKEWFKPLQVRSATLPCNTAVICVFSAETFKSRILYRMQCCVAEEVYWPKVFLAIYSCFNSNNWWALIKDPLYKSLLRRGEYDLPFFRKRKCLSPVGASRLKLGQQFLVGHFLEVNKSRDIACNSHIR